MTRTVPPGWRRVRLGDVARHTLGKMLDRANPGEGRAYPYLRNVNVQWGRVECDDLFEMTFAEDELERFGLLPGDLLVCEGGEPGRAAVWDGRIPEMKYQKALHRVRSSEDLDVRYLRYHLECDARAGRLEEYFSGTTIKHFTGTALADYELVLPSVQEQKLITERLGRLTDRSLRAHAALAVVPALVGRLRQSILASAFRGDLTADWRAAHPDAEPASELLKRIRAERRSRWEQAELARLSAKGRSPSDDRWKTKYQEPEPVGHIDLSELPDGWCWTSIAEIAHIGAGLTKNADKRASATETVPLVSVAAVYMREIRPEGVGAIGLLPEDEDRGKLEPGDLLVVEGNGSLDQVGRVAIWRSEIRNARHQNHLIRLRPVMIASEYLLEWLASPAGREELEDEATSGAGLYTLSLSKVGRVLVPLAPATEQAAIMERLADRLVALRRLEATLQPAGDLLDRVNSAILARAFSGGLNPSTRSHDRHE